VATTRNWELALDALHERSERPTIAYFATIAEEGLAPLYELLRRDGAQERLDVVLATAGGGVSAAHRLALLLREFAAHVRILVPWRARSAGTLVCLSADELVLAPLGHLSPIDAQLGGDIEVAADLPAFVGAEDIRGFREMAREWFGVERESDALQLLALVAQRIFPASLTAFHRADRFVRRIADELLRLPADALTDERRRAVVEALVTRGDTHDGSISRHEARALGLPVRFPEADEEALIWEVWKACDGARHRGVDGSYGLIAGRDFLARETRTWSDDRARLDIEWEVER
jgi:Serine dehydrogenase proteinase